MERPFVTLTEWSELKPLDASGQKSPLFGMQLTSRDWEMVAALNRDRKRIKVEQGALGVTLRSRAFVGTVELESLQIRVLPKIGLRHCVQMIGYAYGVQDLTLTEGTVAHLVGDAGLADLLGLALLERTERLVRSGLLVCYQERDDVLTAPRGRLDIGDAHRRPRQVGLRCRFDELTTDHTLNRALAAGLRLAAEQVSLPDLGMTLTRTADRFFDAITRVPMESSLLEACERYMDRRAAHYRETIALIYVLFMGWRPGEWTPQGDLQLHCFMLNMDVVFERFLRRYFQKWIPTLKVDKERVRDVFHMNRGLGKVPEINPDLVFRRNGAVIAVGDAKYKDRQTMRPTTSELYQVITYAQAFATTGPRLAYLFYPSAEFDGETVFEIDYRPAAEGSAVTIRSVKVPIEGILAEDGSWQPDFLLGC